MAAPVVANLRISLNVECLECFAVFDLLDTKAGAGTSLLQDALRWDIRESERIECSTECPCCHHEFQVKGIDY